MREYATTDGVFVLVGTIAVGKVVRWIFVYLMGSTRIVENIIYEMSLSAAGEPCYLPTCDHFVFGAVACAHLIIIGQTDSSVVEMFMV